MAEDLKSPFPKEDIQMANRYMKDAQYHLLLEKCKSKLQSGTTSHWSEWASLKSIQIISTGQDVEKMKPSDTVGGIINWCATMKNSMEISKK